MNIERRERGGVVVLGFEGRLDASTSPDAEKDVSEVLDGGASKLLIDLGKLDYISSAGLRVMLVAAKRMRKKNGKIVLSSLTEDVREVFDISGFSSIFTIADNEDAALAMFAAD